MKKTILLISLLLMFLLLFSSCETSLKNPSLDVFSTLAPSGWTCEIVLSDFNPNDIPKNANQPLAIIKYVNTERTYEWAGHTQIHPSLTLDFYPIEQKQELVEFIKSQQMYSWCIPEYFGETNRYFILTSPCFKNNGVFTDDANKSVDDLHRALEKVITRKNYSLIGE